MQKSEKPLNNPILLLDLDGTVADPFRAIGSSLRYAFDKLSLGKLTDEQIRKLIGPPFYQSFPEQFGFSDTETKAIIEVYREHHATEGIAMYSPYQGMNEVLEELAKSHRLFLATSKPQIYAQEILTTFKFLPFFDGVYGPELDGTRSNKTDLLEYLLREEGLNSAQCVMIGDRKHDIIAGKNTGTKTMGVLWGYGSREELASHDADHLIEHVHQLKNGVNHIFGS